MKGIPRGIRVRTNFGKVFSSDDTSERFSSTRTGTRADHEGISGFLKRTIGKSLGLTCIVARGKEIVGVSRVRIMVKNVTCPTESGHSQ